jgi:hypothetical protein
MKDRLLKNPITSLIGLILIGCGVYVLQLDVEDTVQLTVSVLLIGGGLVALGLKDKSDENAN